MPSNLLQHFSPEDAALVLIDFQPQMFMGVESHDRLKIRNNLQIIAKAASNRRYGALLAADVRDLA